jgi:hypothetical protein
MFYQPNRHTLQKITKELILKFIAENDIELKCTQSRLCVPIIERIYKKMLLGLKFSEIKVDDGLICDGHHRYLASLLANYSIPVTPFNRTSATVINNWESVDLEEDDWDTAVKIRMLNEMDAIYNAIPLAELLELLK